MKRAYWIVLAIIAAIAVPALAEMQVQRIVRPVVTPPPAAAPSTTEAIGVDSPAFDVANDPERARALIQKLNQEKRELKLQLNDSNAKLSQALATVDEWTKKGGSLVHAYCASDTLSKRSDGAGQEDCQANGGFACSQAEGTCYRSCTVSTQCAGGYVCDPCHSKCVSSSAPPPECN